nr:hypothetical protein [Tanacetum cinerariifolium]
VNKEYQAYRDELDRLMSQEKEASDVVDALIKEFEQGCMDQRGTTTAGNTNPINTVSNSVNASSTSGTFSAGGPTSPHPDAFIPSNTLLHVNQDDSQIPDLEDTMVSQALDDESWIEAMQEELLSMIGSLMYLTASRPDIMFAVCACSRFQVTPKISHLHVVKRIFRRLISWQCKKQTIVATYTTKPEYVAALNCCGQMSNHGDKLVSAAGFSLYCWMKLFTTVNSVKQIHAIVDGKAVVISELSVRSDLLFND